MRADIRVTGDTIEIMDAHDLDIRAKDLKLDSSERRSDVHVDRPRRALVHNFDDGLTLNWAKDYPGGVNVEGHLESTGSAAFRRAFAERLVVDGDVRLTRPDDWPNLGEPPPGFGPDEPTSTDPMSVDEFTLDLGLDTHVTIDTSLAERLSNSIDLRHELARLRAEIAHLRDRVHSLESSA